MRTKNLVRAALIAALYVTVSLIWSPFSFGAVQLRISEALTLLPVFCPEAVVGVTIGCLISNLLFSTPLDVIVGTTATLLAAFMTRRLRKVRVGKLAIPAALPPIVVNAFAIGILLTVQFIAPPRAFGAYVWNIVTVGAGQIGSCLILGVLLVWAIEKSPPLMRLLGSDSALS
ncbi:MAG: QueT transporter family protein [Oscillospiraceae bacterium]